MDSQPNRDIREMFQAAAQKKWKKSTDVITLDKWEEISKSISEKYLITLKRNTFPVCKASLKARIVWSRNLEILDLMLIKVPSTMLLVETVKGVFKFFSYLLLHRLFCFFLFSNLTFANQHFNPFRVGSTFTNKKFFAGQTFAKMSKNCKTRKNF